MCLDKMSNVVLQTYIYIYIPINFYTSQNQKNSKKAHPIDLDFFFSTQPKTKVMLV